MVDGLTNMETTTTQMEFLLILPLTQNSTIQKINTINTHIVKVMKKISSKNNLADPASNTLMNRMRLKIFIIQKLQLI